MLKQLETSDPRVEIGFGTYASSEPTLRPHHAGNRIVIGKFCSLAHGVKIFAGGNHPLDYVTTHPIKLFFGLDSFESWSSDCNDDLETTRIGNDVWCGDSATILSGSLIGDGAVIGAHAVVKGSVPPYSIVVGNPAKIIGTRFPESVVEKLLAIKWWGWPANLIQERAEEIGSKNIESFITKYNSESG